MSLGCFCKDQVYLTGILQILKIRHSLDFHLLCSMGKIAYEDIEMLKPHFNSERTKIPSFMQDLVAYRAKLDYIVEVNGLDVWLEPTPNDKERTEGEKCKENRLHVWLEPSAKEKEDTADAKGETGKENELHQMWSEATTKHKKDTEGENDKEK